MLFRGQNEKSVIGKSMSDQRTLGVMALPDVVFFPKMTLPLFIFEPRYRQLLEESLDADRMFAVTRLNEGEGEGVFGLGLLKTVVRNRDGTYHLIVEGMERLQTLSVESREPILRVAARSVEQSSSGEFTSGQKDRILKRLRPYDDGQGKVLDFMDHLDGLDLPPGEFADTVAASFLSSSDHRQAILEELCPNKRLTLLEEILENVRLN